MIIYTDLIYIIIQFYQKVLKMVAYKRILACSYLHLNLCRKNLAIPAIIIDNQRNGLETQAKSLMISVIWPDTLYFGPL